MNFQHFITSIPDLVPFNPLVCPFVVLFSLWFCSLRPLWLTPFPLWFPFPFALPFVVRPFESTASLPMGMLLLWYGFGVGVERSPPPNKREWESNCGRRASPKIESISSKKRKQNQNKQKQKQKNLHLF